MRTAANHTEVSSKRGSSNSTDASSNAVGERDRSRSPPRLFRKGTLRRLSPRVSCESPADTTAVYPEGPGAQPAQPPSNAPQLLPERAGVLPPEQQASHPTGVPPQRDEDTESYDEPPVLPPEGTYAATPVYIYIGSVPEADERGTTGSLPSNPTRAELAKSRRTRQLQPDTSAFREDLFPGASPSFQYNDLVERDTGAQRMEAARRIACVLAMHELPGFENVLLYLEQNQPRSVSNWRRNHIVTFAPTPSLIYRVRDAFIIIASTDFIPPTAVVAAAHCGGVEPGESGYGPPHFSPDWLEWADPGVDVYHDLMQDVLARMSHIPPHHTREEGLYELMQLKPVQCADVIRAYLAAADATARLIDHNETDGMVPWRRPYESLEGSVFPFNDEVSQFINMWIKRFYAMFPPQ